MARGSRRAGRCSSRSVRLDAPEGDAAEGLGELQAAHPDVQIGCYPFFENKRLGTYIVLRSVDEAKLAAAENALWKFIAEEGFQLPPATAEPAFVHKANHGENLRARWRFVLDRPAYEGHQGHATSLAFELERLRVTSATASAADCDCR